jgi:anaerobic selenocysteine-containing dehydrogenase
MDEIAAQIERVITRDGPRAIASYSGTMSGMSSPTMPFLNAFFEAIGSRMQFTSNTIDKPGKYIARALHGRWMAPAQGYDEPDVGLLVGLNPFVAYQGLPHTNPGKWLSEQQARGFKLVVVDPRRNDVARRATIHLQVRPGHDAPVLAAMLRVIVTEELFDAAFVDAHVEGFAELRAGLEPFDADTVARAAGIQADDLVAAARLYGSARRAYAVSGTGPNFSGPGTLNEYLTLCFMTLCGNYLRAGETVRHQRSLLPALSPRAQAAPRGPAYGFGERLRVRGLANTAAGLPTAALPDEILLEGPGQVRALISCGGNPVAAWPDQLKAIEALRSLELLVQIDPWMSQTARLAHYIVPPLMGFEIPGLNFLSDFDADFGAGYGRVEAWGQYTPALVAPPEGSELVEEWRFFRGLAERLRVPLVLSRALLDRPVDPPVSIDMDHEATTDELLEMLTRGSRVPLAAIKESPGGGGFPGPSVIVAPGDPASNDRLDVGNGEMMDDLHAAAAGLAEYGDDGEFDLRMICRRATHVMNSSFNFASTNRGRAYNPAFLHPRDLERLGLESGDAVRIESRRGSIPAIVLADGTLRSGLVSMSHSFGGFPEDDDRYTELGSCTGRLGFDDERYDRYSGQPLMSNIPVRIVPSSATADGRASASH